MNSADTKTPTRKQNRSILDKWGIKKCAIATPLAKEGTARIGTRRYALRTKGAGLSVTTSLRTAIGMPIPNTLGMKVIAARHAAYRPRPSGPSSRAIRGAVSRVKQIVASLATAIIDGDFGMARKNCEAKCFCIVGPGPAACAPSQFRRRLTLEFISP